MVDESRFPTLRFLECRRCRRVFVAGLSGNTECPDCSSSETSNYTPESKENDSEQEE